MKALLNAVTGHFPSGQLICDALHPWVVARTGANVAGTGASYRWGIDDPRDIKRLDPKLNLVKEYTRPELVAYRRFPIVVRALFLLLDNVPAVRRMERLLVYRF